MPVNFPPSSCVYKKVNEESTKLLVVLVFTTIVKLFYSYLDSQNVVKVWDQVDWQQLKVCVCVCGGELLMLSSVK